MNSRVQWMNVNHQLIAKSIGELTYEQVVSPIQVEGNSFVLNLRSGTAYCFEGWKTVWDYLRVDAATLKRVTPESASTEIEAATFFKDAQAEMKMEDIVLGQFLEEMQSTLFSDLTLAEKFGEVSAAQLAQRNGNEIQSALNGHPKLLLNKGRLGWGAADLEHYSPEGEKTFQLHWLSIATSLVQSSRLAGFTTDAIASQSLDSATMARFQRDGFELLPVHPWQWDRIIRIQYAGDIARGDIISLGQAGNFYRPQISLRTLANVTRPEMSDIKLPLSILNTSAVRGIPARYISTAPAIAEAITKLCEQDPVLRNTVVLRDVAGANVLNSTYANLDGAPYRYKETLGAIWRESVHSKLSQGETAVLTGCLFHQDKYGKSLIGAFISQSTLTTDEWLKHYFEATVIPLYHLQAKYGLGLVAHGQNVVLRLKNGIPTGVFLKDFQGDLRSTNEPTALPLTIRNHLDRLPAHHLIHDLITGHFVTVLRFVSAVLHESDGFTEDRFYSILSQVIRDYVQAHPVDSRIRERIDLLQPRIPRVLLNKVRFKIGYGDLAERPLPMLGQDLVNPLARKEGSING
jgi:aerobactin synthase